MISAINILNKIAPPLTHVKLPFNFSRKTMSEVIELSLDDNLIPRSSRIAFDFSRLAFIDPTAITILSNLIEFLIKKRVKVEFVNYTYPTEGNKFLDDSGFFLRYMQKQIFPNSGLRSTTLPLELIVHEKSHEWIEHKFSPWIENKVGKANDSFTTIKLCLAEVFNNIRDHSGENVGSVFAQYFPRKNEVMLSISDFGVGIPTNVRKAIKNISDENAIIQATVQGFTTKSTVRNRGIGLHVLTQNVVSNNGGTIFINSLKGSVRCFPSASGMMKQVAVNEIASYPGTLLEMKFYTDKLESIGIKEEFEW